MSRNKLGRNDRCWCGSGKKYKKCHLNREAQEPVTRWDASQKMRKAFRVKACSAPEAWHGRCNQLISRAHTVPKSGSLRRIARKGHVYAFVPSVENLEKFRGYVPAQLIGLNVASTFTGFCSHHDHTIFRPVEDVNFLGSQEQCFLLAYRALAREAYTKRAAASLVDFLRDSDKGRSTADQQWIQAINVPYGLGLEAGVRDSEYFKSTYDHILVEDDFISVRAYVIEFDRPPNVMCSGGVFPEKDFTGRELQDISDLTVQPQLLTFTSFFGGERGAVVFTWLPESDEICKQFISSLHSISDASLTDELLRFFFENCENVYMEPDWWENLPVHTRDAVIQRMVPFGTPLSEQSETILVDDSVHFPPWRVIRRKCVGFEI